MCLKTTAKQVICTEIIQTELLLTIVAGNGLSNRKWCSVHNHLTAKYMCGGEKLRNEQAKRNSGTKIIFGNQFDY